MFFFGLSLAVGWAFGHYGMVKTPIEIFLSSASACLLAALALLFLGFLVGQHLAHAESIGFLQVLPSLLRLPVLRRMVFGFWVYFGLMGVVIRWRMAAHKRHAEQS